MKIFVYRRAYRTKKRSGKKHSINVLGDFSEQQHRMYTLREMTYNQDCLKFAPSSVFILHEKGIY